MNLNWWTRIDPVEYDDEPDMDALVDRAREDRWR